MAQDKKSFIAYVDWGKVFDELDDAEAGRLAKHLFRYVNDENPEPPDKLTKLVFIPIMNTLKNDLKKWENYTEKQKANGLKGGRPKIKKANETQITQAFLSEPKKADSVSVNVNVNDNVLHKCNYRENILPPENKNFYIKTEDMENYMISDTKWFDVICMQNNWTEQQAKHQIHEFIKKLRAENVLEKHKNDCFSHFSNWINQKLYGSQSNKSGKNPITASDYDGSYAKKRPITSAI